MDCSDGLQNEQAKQQRNDLDGDEECLSTTRITEDGSWRSLFISGSLPLVGRPTDSKKTKKKLINPS